MSFSSKWTPPKLVTTRDTRVAVFPRAVTACLSTSPRLLSWSPRRSTRMSWFWFDPAAFRRRVALHHALIVSLLFSWW